MAIYFTSDWHLNEKRIDEKLNLFFRPFKSVEEQNRTIIDNLNSIVKKDDILYVVGDACMDIAAVDMLNEINCKNRVLITGNYDMDKLVKLKEQFPTICSELELKVGDLECYLNHYPTKYVKNKFNIVGHIHGLWKVKPNMVNVSVDAWHFKPVSEKEILFIQNAIAKAYDDNVFVYCEKERRSYR